MSHHISFLLHSFPQVFSFCTFTRNLHLESFIRLSLPLLAEHC